MENDNTFPYPTNPDIKPLPDAIPDELKGKPYEICMYFANPEATPGASILGYFTYIAYKEAKIRWILNYQLDNYGDEPSQEEKKMHVENLTAEDYQKYVVEGYTILEQTIKSAVSDAISEMTQEETTDNSIEQ